MEDQAFFDYTIRLLAHPSSFPLSRQQGIRFSCGSTVELTDGSGWRGWARSRIIRQRETLVLYRSQTLSASLLPTLPSSTIRSEMLRFSKHLHKGENVSLKLSAFTLSSVFLLINSRAILFLLFIQIVLVEYSMKS
jgi:hypothetical protein